MTDHEKALILAILDNKRSSKDDQPLEEMRRNIKKASNEKILRKQLELLAEYSHRMQDVEKIPEASQAMVAIYKVLTGNCK